MQQGLPDHSETHYDWVIEVTVTNTGPTPITVDRMEIGTKYGEGLWSNILWTRLDGARGQIFGARLAGNRLEESDRQVFEYDGRDVSFRIAKVRTIAAVDTAGRRHELDPVAFGKVRDCMIRNFGPIEL